MLSLMFVLNKSLNFTSDYSIQIPPTVPLYHYSKKPHPTLLFFQIFFYYPMLSYSVTFFSATTQRPASKNYLKHSNLFKVKEK